MGNAHCSKAQEHIWRVKSERCHPRNISQAVISQCRMLRKVYSPCLERSVAARLTGAYINATNQTLPERQLSSPCAERGC